MTTNDFSNPTKANIAKSAMLICANPTCLRFTGYATTQGDARAIAEAAHILPSGSGGPRSDQIPSFPLIDICSVHNGIWLCAGCHKRVDDDPVWYTASMLFDWKKKHEAMVRRLVGLDLEAVLFELRGSQTHHQKTRKLLSFLDGRRALYEGLDSEFPPRVLQSVEMMREQIAETRAEVSSTTRLAKALGQMQTSIDSFLRRIGPKIDLTTLQCDSRDPAWLKFRDELVRFRSEMIVIVAYLAEGSGYEVTHAY